jgi:NADP-dependent 3-hydroxy acid dehydrogenase YdfG
MPLLTKKFTRDSLKRASGSAAGIPDDSEEQSKEMIRREMARARAKSMRSRNALNQQQRRHRSLSRGPSSPYRSFGLENVEGKTDSGGPKLPNISHPNDEYSQAYNEAELLTQMSSLTEPTWAPSVVGGSDINSAHRRHSHQNQRSRTGNYNNVRHQTRFQHNNARVHQSRATITISTAKDHKETKILFLDGREKEEGNVGPNKINSDRGHHERASIGTEGIEVHHIVRDEGREDGDDKTVETNTKRIPNNTASSDMRDGVPDDDVVLQTPKTKHSSSRRRSNTRQDGEDRNDSRTRGRSGRPSSCRKSKKRSSSVSSQRSTRSATTALTTPTISKYSATSSSRSTSVASRKSKTDTPAIARRRTTGGKEKSSTIMRSSSVPPSTSNSKRSQRTSSVPPENSKMREMQSLRSDSKNNGRDNDNVVSTGINRYVDAYEHHRSSKTNSEPNKEAMHTTLNTASTMMTTASSQSKSQSTVSFVTGSRSSGVSPLDCPLTPSSAVEAARISLRPRLRCLSSSRSISSAQTESIISPTSYRQATPAEKALEKSQTSPSVTPGSPSKTAYTSRIHKLAQDVRVKKIHEQRQQRRHELEMEKQRLQQKEEHKRRRKEARVATSAIEADGEEPHHTTVTTILFDFLVFHLLLLFALPQRAVLYLWSRTFSKKWTTRRKNVLLTGANSALGSETARQFAVEGANLILLSHSTTSSENGLNWLVEECHELGSGKIRSYSADLSNAISTELTLRQAAKDFNDIFDVVILNGENKSHGCLFEEIVDVHQIEKMVTENTLGCMMSLHYSLKHIPKTSDSRIVILSSTSGMVASPYRSVYGATQHALKGFCDSIRMELNDTYTERRAPKICFASFPELVGQNIHNRDNFDPRMSRMGANVAPMKSRSWAGTPLQQAVHGLFEAISSGERDFGAPQYVNVWRFIQVLAPGLVDFSIFRHFRKTQYRPVEGDRDASIGRKGGKGDGASVSNKTWSQ